MRTVYVHVNESGAWALTKCPCCREVHKYPLDVAVDHAMGCKSCGQSLDIRRAMGTEVDAAVTALARHAHRSKPAAALDGFRDVASNRQTRP